MEPSFKIVLFQDMIYLSMQETRPFLSDFKVLDGVHAI